MPAAGGQGCASCRRHPPGASTEQRQQKSRPQAKNRAARRLVSAVCSWCDADGPVALWRQLAGQGCSPSLGRSCRSSALWRRRGQNSFRFTHYGKRTPAVTSHRWVAKILHIGYALVCEGKISPNISNFLGANTYYLTSPIFQNSMRQ